MTWEDWQEEAENKEFEKWLSGKGEAETVGRTASKDGCPIAEYYKAKGFKNPSVEFNYVRYSDQEVRGFNQKPLTYKLKLFMLRIDRILDDDTVTARQSLNIWHSLPAKPQGQ